MGFGVSILLIAVGAILKFAVTDDVKGVDLEVVGLILMIIGFIGLLVASIWGIPERDGSRPGRRRF